MNKKESQLTKDIYRMIRTLSAKTLSETQRKSIEEDVAYKQKKLQDHMGVKTFIRPMNNMERKAAAEKRKANSNEKI
tara:strand:+ start:717 stop:947 length:231 start_codon:yes stop_codon:yes gene_type:complete